MDEFTRRQAMLGDVVYQLEILRDDALEDGMMITAKWLQNAIDLLMKPC